MEQKKFSILKWITAAVFAVLIIWQGVGAVKEILHLIQMMEGNTVATIINICTKLLSNTSLLVGFGLILAAALLRRPRLLAVIGCIVVALSYLPGMFGNSTKLITLLRDIERYYNPYYQQILSSFLTTGLSTAVYLAAFLFAAVVILLPGKVAKIASVVPALLIVCKIPVVFVGVILYVNALADKFVIPFREALTNQGHLNTLVLATGLVLLCLVAANAPRKSRKKAANAQSLPEETTAEA